MTLLLARSEILRFLDLRQVLAALRAGFEHPSSEGLRVRTDLPGPGTATALLPGLVPGIAAYTVKVNAKFPGASPALRGVVCLHDLADGALLAILDSATVTSWRTGLAAALATDVLAAPDARSVGVIGTGAQAALVVRGLGELRPIEEVIGYDLEPERVPVFAAEVGRAVATAADAREVAARADIVVLATWSREVLLSAADVRPGQHLTTLGVDEPGKAELSHDLLLGATTVVDDVALAVRMGAVDEDAVDATLTEVLTGAEPGRVSAEEITVYAPVGLPWQDLAVAWPVYEAAVASGVGQQVDFLT